ncbi:hypothetical protein Trco_006553 [Trichoderma cornu-damae]|uniref:Uncharacterized protein n=1 Tax=Trichoderma cornu-damae TaxID=654480 RepID=A0A9P8QH20_9HYPO|nr:hypothetical protein Trco_006553 [Trichoderma cornu-damae]
MSALPIIPKQNSHTIAAGGYTATQPGSGEAKGSRCAYANPEELRESDLAAALVERGKVWVVSPAAARLLKGRASPAGNRARLRRTCSPDLTGGV